MQGVATPNPQTIGGGARPEVLQNVLDQAAAAVTAIGGVVPGLRLMVEWMLVSHGSGLAVFGTAGRVTRSWTDARMMEGWLMPPSRRSDRPNGG